MSSTWPQDKRVRLVRVCTWTPCAASRSSARCRALPDRSPRPIPDRSPLLQVRGCRELSWTHPAISQHMRRLERAAGCALVARHGCGFRLASAGTGRAAAGTALTPASTALTPASTALTPGQHRPHPGRHCPRSQASSPTCGSRCTSRLRPSTPRHRRASPGRPWMPLHRMIAGSRANRLNRWGGERVSVARRPTWVYGPPSGRDELPRAALPIHQ
jgi:hypothetical protein